ncbi:MAG: phosphotransferase [Clostridia bacterium]|nr:phosphotransferase [Clostridia bacterium]
MKMHEGELTLSRETIQALLAAQCPQYAALPLSEKDYGGTMNHIYRLGEDKLLRLPRMPGDKTLEKEIRWINHLQPQFEVRFPAPLFVGAPTETYPCVWAVFDWIPGTPCGEMTTDEEISLARELAAFVNTLHALPVPEEAPRAGRKPLAVLYEETKQAIEECRPFYTEPAEETAVCALWEEAMHIPVWDGQRRFIHADLLKTNILQENGRLQAILDFGSVGAGDPAMDLTPAWTVFGPAGRAEFRSLLSYDEAYWQRARAYALHQALLIIPYYVHSYPEFTAMALNTVRQILQDTAE